MYNALAETYAARQPIDWPNVSTRFDPVCQSAVGYVEDITRSLKPSPTPTSWLPAQPIVRTPVLPRVLETPTPTEPAFRRTPTPGSSLSPTPLATSTPIRITFGTRTVTPTVTRTGQPTGTITVTPTATGTIIGYP
jgi:hypothetical protein